MSVNYAQQWKQKIATQEPVQTVVATFAGFTGVFRRLPREAWVRAGRLPYFLVEQLNEAVEVANGRTLEEARGELEAKAKAKAKAVSKEEFEAEIKVSREIVCYVSVDPRIVESDTPAEDEISYSELSLRAPEVVDKIALWALAGSPNIPAGKIDGMEVGVEDVARFRDKGRGKSTAGPGGKVSKVRRKPRARIGRQ